MKVEVWQLQKIKEMREKGMSYRDISFELGLSHGFIEYVCKNMKSLEKSMILENTNEKSKDIQKDTQNLRKLPKGFREIKFEIHEKDYMVFMKIKDEIKKRIGNIADEYVFLKLLEAYREKEKIEEENKKLKKHLKNYANFL